ncbi:MAG: hypothetical protein ABTB30_09495 [Clostridia bacterium]
MFSTADQEFLASFGVEIDETGLLRLQEALTKNRALADDLAAAFNRAQEAMTSFFDSMTEISMPTLDFGSGGITGEAASGLSIPFSLDMTRANRELNTFFKEAGKNLKLTADASGVLSAGRSALNSLRSLYNSTPLSVRANVQTSSASGGGINLNTMLKAATGGRFTRPQQVEIAEDGDPEYVIPVKKEGIAVPLLRQLIGELSASARESLQGGSLGGLSGMLSSVAGATAPTVNQTNNNSVQAPVSINVTASGSDPEAVGRSVYDVAEQYLLRTLKGAI